MGHVREQPPRQVYRLTKAGQHELEQQANGWMRLSQAVSRAVTSTDL
jgi:DNA-binding PadR family transcriptional regulator